MNPIFFTDAYSIASHGFAPETARAYSCYNFTNRISPAKAFPGVAKDSRMVLFGVKYFINKYMTQRVTVQDVREAELFFDTFHSFGGKYYFPKDLWMKVAVDCGGYLPLTIKSLLDGSTFFPYEPVIQVEAQNGFGELAAHIEARLVGMVSNATAAATLCRHWRERIAEQIMLDGVSYEEAQQQARWMIHNFGSRACVSGEESEVIGMAHLLSFNGTDNLDAAFNMRKDGVKPPIATSILALAHRNVQSWDSDNMAYSAICNTEAECRPNDTKIVSCVGDCYDFALGLEAVSRLALKHPECIFVTRPDSGDGKSQLLDVCNKAKELGLAEEKNGLLYPKNLKFIYGDSVTPAYMMECMNHLRQNGFAATAWGIYGVGGYIVNHSTRDTLSSAFKLASVYNGPRLKISNTPAKMSVPYNTAMRVNVKVGSPRVYTCEEAVDERYVVYDKQPIEVPWSYSNAIALNDNWFNQYVDLPSEWGLNRESLCHKIQEFQNSFA